MNKIYLAIYKDNHDKDLLLNLPTTYAQVFKIEDYSRPPRRVSCFSSLLHLFCAWRLFLQRPLNLKFLVFIPLLVGLVIFIA